MSTSTDNMFCFTGRITSNICGCKNRDGSCKIKMTIAVPLNYEDEDGRRGVQFIDIEKFLATEADNLIAYDYIHTHEGEFITVSGRVLSSVYQDKKTGEVIIDQVFRVDEMMPWGCKEFPL